MNNTTTASLEVVEQLITFISDMTKSEYQFIAKPLFTSTIGQHLRHIVDLYRAIQLGLDSRVINYDYRRRGALIETDRHEGIKELESLRSWLQTLDSTAFDMPVSINSEISLSQQTSETYISSLGRELNFASSHLIHHLAIMAAIAKSAGMNANPSLGTAPATATYNRNNANNNNTKNTQKTSVCAH